MPAAIVEAALPDPSSPAIVPIAAVLGGFVGALIARLHGLTPEQRRELTESGAFYTTAAGLVVYAIAQIAQAA